MQSFAAPATHHRPSEEGGLGGVELRQVSGITSGEALPFAVGMEITLDGETIDFRLDLNDDDEIVVTPIAVPIRLDEELITTTTKVGRRVIDVGRARFVLASRRSPATRSESRHAASDWALGDRGQIDDEPGVEVPWPGNLHQLTQRVRHSRQQILIRARAAQPDPEELMFHATEHGPRLWSRQPDHRHFGRVAVAHADLPWRPRFDRPDRVSTREADALHSFLVLPSVPIAADLLAGPLGVVGSREATLAIGRQVILSIATLSPPSAVDVSVLSGSINASDWGWADFLPHATDSRATAMSVAIVDHIDLADTHQLCGEVGFGSGPAAVFLTDNPGRLPADCANVVVVNDDFSCMAMDHRRGTTTPKATPLGISPELAIRAAIALRASGDEEPMALAPSIKAVASEHGYERAFF